MEPPHKILTLFKKLKFLDCTNLLDCMYYDTNFSIIDTHFSNEDEMDKVLKDFKVRHIPLGDTEYVSIDEEQCYCDYKIEIPGHNNIYVMIDKPLADDACNKLTEWEGFENLWLYAEVHQVIYTL